MHLRYSLIFIFFFISCSLSKGIAPSDEVKQPFPEYWNDTSIEGLVTHQTCSGVYELPKLIGGITSLENRITFPNDGNKYYQEITAAFLININGKAEKIWFPHHTQSVATEAVKKAILASDFKPSFCNGEPGVTKYAVTVHARN